LSYLPLGIRGPAVRENMGEIVIDPSTAIESSGLRYTRTAAPLLHPAQGGDTAVPLLERSGSKMVRPSNELSRFFSVGGHLTREIGGYNQAFESWFLAGSGDFYQEHTEREVYSYRLLLPASTAAIWSLFRAPFPTLAITLNELAFFMSDSDFRHRFDKGVLGVVRDQQGVLRMIWVSRMLRKFDIHAYPVESDGGVWRSGYYILVAC
jgi:hypothetical protein